MRRLAVAFAIAGTLALLLLSSSAFGYDEPGDMPEQHVGTVIQDCLPCHRASENAGMCESCHGSHGNLGETAGKGPHGLYSTATDRCDACHDVHAAGGADLLPSATITASCFTCHDGSGGKGVYGSIAQRGRTVKGAHRVDTTTIVPGGDRTNGGPKTMSFTGAGGNLGCDDCHSPHDARTVTAYSPERQRTTSTKINQYDFKTSKLLRRNPGGSVATATAYGSDWCLACHAGRTSLTPLHNHPVDASGTVAVPFTFDSVAALRSDDPTRATVMRSMARTNRGYLMPAPRTIEQSGHAPICQQCHEDARNVGSLSADGLTGDAAPYSVVSTEGLNGVDDPLFQDFPHETLNDTMTVESADDLCLNCHPPAALP